MRYIIATLGLVVGTAMLAPAPAEAQTCKSYRSCEEAVKNWCEGRHPRADGDKDGIPCENVCRSKSQVDRIRNGRSCPG